MSVVYGIWALVFLLIAVIVLVAAHTSSMKEDEHHSHKDEPGKR